MWNRVGEIAYFYCGFEVGEKWILPGRTLRMSSFATMRDPGETGSWSPRFTGDFAATDPDDSTRIMRQVIAEIEAARKRTKILCVTIDQPGLPPDPLDNFGRGWANPHLWEHYAEQHAGLCIGVEIEKLVAAVEVAVPGVNHRQVTYTDDLIDIDALTFSWEDLIRDGVQHVVERQLAAFRTDLFFTKVSAFRNECEYRFAVHTGDEDPVYVDVGDAVCEVILGHKGTEDQTARLAAVCEPYGIPVVGMRWIDRQPFIEPAPGSGVPGAISLNGIRFRAADRPAP